MTKYTVLSCIDPRKDGNYNALDYPTLTAAMDAYETIRPQIILPGAFVWLILRDGDTLIEIQHHADGTTETLAFRPREDYRPINL